MAATTGSVQSIDRIFDIVEVLAQWPQGMALSDLATATGLHVSTAHRLVQSLIRRGYAIDDEEHEQGVRCIAVAIRNSFHLPVAAISVSAPASRLDDATMTQLYPQLAAISSELSRMLGECSELN